MQTMTPPAMAGSSSATTARYYRPELDVIRLAAFLCVFGNHIFRIPSLAFGLSLFFALSAYLITTLLLRERAKTGSINLTKFYKRRMLRIWPLYLAALGAGLLHDYHVHALYLARNWYIGAFFMLGNVIGTHSFSTDIGQLWSISVEEQFYVVWPGIMRRLTYRKIACGAGVILVVSNATMVYFGLVHANIGQRVWWNTFIQMEMFAAGIFLALRDHRRSLRAFSWPVRILCLAGIAGAWYAAANICHIWNQAFATGPISLVVGFALVAGSCALLINVFYGIQRWPKFLLYGGKISYGLYVFHIGAFHLAGYFHQGALCAFFITIITAALSYRFLESPFLRWKETFEVVPTRPVELDDLPRADLILNHMS